MIPRLSQNDDEIYGKFRADFPDMTVAKLDEMKDLKSPEMKEKWRGFCEEFKHVEDYSFATLIRLDSRWEPRNGCSKRESVRNHVYYIHSQDYEEANSVIVTKIQFYAIELARNREGHNDQIRHNFKPKKRKTKVTQEQDQFHSNLTQEVQHELQSILGGNHPLMK